MQSRRIGTAYRAEISIWLADGTQRTRGNLKSEINHFDGDEKIGNDMATFDFDRVRLILAWISKWCIYLMDFVIEIFILSSDAPHYMYYRTNIFFAAE